MCLAKLKPNKISAVLLGRRITTVKKMDDIIYYDDNSVFLIQQQFRMMLNNDSKVGSPLSAGPDDFDSTAKPKSSWIINTDFQ